MNSVGVGKLYKKMGCGVLTAAIVLFSFPAAIAKGHWAQDSINTLAAEEIISGDADGMRPDDYITRAEFSRVINKLLNLTAPSENYFNDVSREQWYFNDMHIARQAGYFIGDDLGNANPEGFLTRAEACVAYARLLKLSIFSESVPFADGNDIPSWARGAVDALNKSGIITGYPNGEFRPTSPMTRAEMFTTAVRMRNYNHQENNVNDNVQATPAATNMSGKMTAGLGSSSGTTVNNGSSNGSNNSQQGPSSTKIIRFNSDTLDVLWEGKAGSSSYSLKITRTTEGVAPGEEFVGPISELKYNIRSKLQALTASDRQENESFEIEIKSNIEGAYSDKHIFSMTYPVLTTPEISVDSNTRIATVTGDTNTSSYVIEVYEDSDRLVKLGEVTALGGPSQSADLSSLLNMYNKGYYLTIKALGNDDYLSAQALEYNYWLAFLPSVEIVDVVWKSENNIEKYEISWEKLDREEVAGYRIEVLDSEQDVLFTQDVGKEITSFGIYEIGGLEFGGELTVGITVVADDEMKNSSRSVTGVNTMFAGGKGTNEAPYIIKLPRHFDKIRAESGAMFSLEEDITLPSDYAPFSFSGTLIGDDPINLKSIHVTITGSTDNTGLFSATTESALIKNISLSGTVSGTSRVAGFVGTSSNGSIIENCINNANVSATGNYVGGFVGWGTGTINNIVKCINYGSISGVTGSGGIAGYGPSILNCANFGTVIGRGTIAGGIVGYAQGNVTACYNAGNVSTTHANGFVGGIAGYAAAGAGRAIESCYNLGKVTATATPTYPPAGIICGNNDTIAYTVRNCFDINSGTAHPIGYFTGAKSFDNCYYYSDISVAIGTPGTAKSLSDFDSWESSSDFSLGSDFQKTEGHPYPDLKNNPYIGSSIGVE